MWGLKQIRMWHRKWGKYRTCGNVVRNLGIERGKLRSISKGGSHKSINDYNFVFFCRASAGVIG